MYCRVVLSYCTVVVYESKEVFTLKMEGLKEPMFFLSETAFHSRLIICILAAHRQKLARKVQPTVG